MPNDNLDDEDISEIVDYCQEWRRLLPVLFPERNVTRKGHAMSIHILEYLELNYVFCILIIRLA